jgi:hypothetical protein
LQLHRGYNILGLKDRNAKIEQQFVRPFEVLERIGRLAYKIRLPLTLKFHITLAALHYHIIFPFETNFETLNTGLWKDAKQTTLKPFLMHQR